jgi:hypothetical protein
LFSVGIKTMERTKRSFGWFINIINSKSKISTGSWLLWTY